MDTGHSSIQYRLSSSVALLHKEIIPKLNKLCKEKHLFLQWQKASFKLEWIGQLLCAWQWTEGCDRVLCKEANIGTKEQDVAHVKKEEVHHNKELLNAKKKV